MIDEQVTIVINITSKQLLYKEIENDARTLYTESQGFLVNRHYDNLNMIPYRELHVDYRDSINKTYFSYVY